MSTTYNIEDMKESFKDMLLNEVGWSVPRAPVIEENGVAALVAPDGEKVALVPQFNAQGYVTGVQLLGKELNHSIWAERPWPKEQLTGFYSTHVKTIMEDFYKSYFARKLDEAGILWGTPKMSEKETGSAPWVIEGSCLYIMNPQGVKDKWRIFIDARDLHKELYVLTPEEVTVNTIRAMSEELANDLLILDQDFEKLRLVVYHLDKKFPGYKYSGFSPSRGEKGRLFMISDDLELEITREGNKVVMTKRMTPVGVALKEAKKIIKYAETLNPWQTRGLTIASPLPMEVDLELS